MRKLLLVFTTLFATLFCACTDNYSSGSKIGILSTVQNQGLVWKSTELSLKTSPALTAGTTIQTNTVNMEWTAYDYSIDNDGTIQCSTPLDSIEEWRNRGQMVELHYQEVRGKNWFNNRGHSNYFVTQITPIKR